MKIIKYPLNLFNTTFSSEQQLVSSIKDLSNTLGDSFDSASHQHGDGTTRKKTIPCFGFKDPVECQEYQTTINYVTPDKKLFYIQVCLISTKSKKKFLPLTELNHIAVFKMRSEKNANLKNALIIPLFYGSETVINYQANFSSSRIIADTINFNIVQIRSAVFDFIVRNDNNDEIFLGDHFNRNEITNLVKSLLPTFQ